MKFSPDQYILLDWGWGRLNATLLFTWIIILLLAGGSWLLTRHLSSSLKISAGQNLLEVLVQGMVDHIEEISQRPARRLLPLVGTLFLFILTSNILGLVPFFQPPTGSLSTTCAFALLVFIAVPAYGLTTRSLKSYLGQYLSPTLLMLPFNLLGEITRTFALAVRLYGNVMSGTVFGMVLLLITPIFVPVLMQALSLLTGVIQAYIFALLALVYIAAAMAPEKTDKY
ncbi:MAG: F0F1 ATP synthase subunit A [Deltaproteobacteria bacterium]|nr:F0F1 ATP synthase subunit A [Deltaproteobacteria bacterium]